MAEHTEFRKYEKIPYLGESEIKLDSGDNEVYEKIDGSNCQVRLVKGRIRAGSRSKFVDTRPQCNLFWFPDLVKWATSQRELYGLPENLILYGEWITEPGKSIQQITYPKQFRNRFFLIDAFDLVQNRFLEYKDAVRLVQELGVDALLLDQLYRGPIDKDILAELLATPSFFRGGNLPLEGIVIKDYEKQAFAKELNPQFSEIRAGEKTPTGIYITFGRVARVSNTLWEDGIRPLPENLTNALIRDVKQEHGIRLDSEEVLKQLKSLKVLQ